MSIHRLSNLAFVIRSDHIWLSDGKDSMWFTPPEGFTFPVKCASSSPTSDLICIVDNSNTLWCIEHVVGPDCWKVRTASQFTDDVKSIDVTHGKRRIYVLLKNGTLKTVDDCCGRVQGTFQWPKGFIGIGGGFAVDEADCVYQTFHNGTELNLVSSKTCKESFIGLESIHSGCFNVHGERRTAAFIFNGGIIKEATPSGRLPWIWAPHLRKRVQFSEQKKAPFVHWSELGQCYKYLGDGIYRYVEEMTIRCAEYHGIMDFKPISITTEDTHHRYVLCEDGCVRKLEINEPYHFVVKSIHHPPRSPHNSFNAKKTILSNQENQSARLG